MHTSFKQALKAQAHHLKPVILLGAKGLTPAVIAETDSALLIHELIKVKINGAEKADRQRMAAELCTALTASLVQLIGNTAIIYRKNEEDCVPVAPSSRPARETHHTGKSAGRPVHSRNRAEDIKNSSRK